MLRQEELKQQLVDMSMEDAGALDTSRASLQRVNQEIDEINRNIESMSSIAPIPSTPHFLRFLQAMCV